MPEKPKWKGVFIDRDFLKTTIKARFIRMGKGKLDEEVGGLVNDLERYLTAELFTNTSEIMQEIVDGLTETIKFYREYAEGIDEKIIQRRAQQLEDKGSD